jgi:surfactin family lipopeptide synthetase A
MLLVIAKKILQTDMIGVTEDLTLQGLSSLDAIKLTALADKKGLKLKVNDILNYKTIRSIVNRGLSFGHWLNDYHPNRPIVVAIQGFSPHQVQTYFDALCSRFSVFFFASLDDYYDEMFNYQSKSEIVARYVKLLHDVLPSNAHIHAFTGHCVGGELAYRCAALWQQETGLSPKLYILNTPLRTDEEVRQLMPSKTVIDQMTPERQDHFKEWQIQHERVSKTLDNVPMPSFKGEVVFFRAPEPFLTVNQLTIDVDAFVHRDFINMQRWHELQPQIEVVTIPANHFTMLEPQYVKLYLEKF